MANLLILMTFWWKFIYDVIIVYASFYSFNFLIQNDVCKRESTTVQSFSNVGISCIITKTRMWRNPPSRQTRRFAMIRIDLCMYFREKVLLDSSFFIFFIDVFLDSIYIYIKKDTIHTKVNNAYWYLNSKNFVTHTNLNTKHFKIYNIWNIICHLSIEW